MKKFPLLAIASTLFAITTGYAAADSSCDTLKANIEKQISIIKASESDNEAQGYQQALNALKSKCDIPGLTSKAQNKINDLQSQMSQIQSETAEAELSLAEALNENDEAKIAELEESVSEKQEKLMELQDTLEITQAELQALTDTMPSNN